MKKILIAFLFILTAIPAAFSAPMEIGEHSSSVIPMECNDKGCVSDPQYQTNQYKPISGTIYYSPQAPVENFDKPVMVEYRSDDGVHSARFTANPHFGFVIPIKAPGTITFTIRDPNSKYTIDPATYKTDDFPPEGRSIVVKEKTAQPAEPAKQAAPATQKSNTDYKTITVNCRVIDKNTNKPPLTSIAAYFSIISGTYKSESVGINSDGYFSLTYDRVPVNTPDENISLVIWDTYNKYATEVINMTQVPKSNCTISLSPKETPATRTTLLTASGVVKDSEGPLPGVYIIVENNDTLNTVTGDDGHFKLMYDKNWGNNVVISSPGYVTQTLPASTGMNITLKLEGIQLKEQEVIGIDICNQSNKLTELYATSAKWKETEESLPIDLTDEDRAAGVGNATANKSICIPTKCKNGYILENEDTVNAKCVKCDTSRIAFSRTVHVVGNRCVLSGKNGCQSGFTPKGDNKCEFNCNDDEVLKALKATKAELKSDAKTPNDTNINYSDYCKATACDETRAMLENNMCVSNAGTSCKGAMKSVEEHATGATFDGNGLCKLESCDNGYDVATTLVPRACDGNIPEFKGLKCSGKCEIQIGGECEFSGENIKSTTGTLDKNGVCKPDCYDNFVAKLNSTKDKYECVIKTDRDGTECTKNELKSMNIAHATAGTVKEWDRATGAVTSCTITECDDGWLPNADGSACDEICTAEITKKLKNDGAFDVRVSDDGKTCVAKSCKCEYTLTDDNKCVAWAESGHTECGKKPEGATGGTPHCDGGKEVCYITTCDEPKYTLEGTAGTANAKCVSNVGKDCNDVVALPENATAGKQREIDGQMKCVATACKTGYDLRPDGSACIPKMVLSKEEYQDQIAELSDNAAAMHEKENSWENRLIGAAGIGLTGVGGMMVGSALSEQTADANAEATMRQYLETFRCDYGDGKLIHGGEVNVELPGGNDMIELYTEYATRAADLKARKEALGMRPGIESEIVIDKAETGLYEYSPDGITGGTYASIARALMDPEGEDAAMWAAQKEATANKLKAGAIVAGVGSVGSLAANIAVNHNNPNKVREILNTYAPLRKPFKDMERKVNDVATQEPTKCSTIAGTTGIGNVPNCQCIDPDARYFHDKGCITCPMNQVYNAEKKCVCPTDKPVLKDDGSCEPKAPDCLLTGLKKDNACECITNARSENNRCVCATGYHESEDSSVKECLKDKEPVPVTNIPTTPTSSILDTGNEIAKISFGTDGLFESSRFELKPTSATKIRSELQNIQTIAQQNNIDLKTATDYCLVVVGKTDRVPFRKGVNSNNQILSEQRARAVAVELQSVFNSDNIRTYGIADNDCHKDKFQRDAQDCRRVDVLFLGGSCADNLSGISNDTAWIKTLAPYAVNALISELSKK